MASDGTQELRHRIVATPIGDVTMVAGERGLTHVFFPNGDPLAEGVRSREAVHDPFLTAAARQLEEYFDGTRERFDLDLDLRPDETSSFEREAWLVLRTIPYGETISYATQAERIGRSGAFRAVGAANGRNPLPIVLPCHRVVGADGSLVGFGSGLPLKRALLDLESGVQQLPLG
ncbi:MAG: methylated-DNA--[protein]-cysteine S-methyltransferase [Actinomycetota bacterium]